MKTVRAWAHSAEAGQPIAKVLPMRGQFLSEAVASSQMTFSGKRVEIETGAGQRFGTIFGVKSYPARTWARMLDALELPYDIVITNSLSTRCDCASKNG